MNDIRLSGWGLNVVTMACSLESGKGSIFGGNDVLIWVDFVWPAISRERAGVQVWL